MVGAGAGIALAAFVIPERISHAHLAGLWPSVGLYSYAAVDAFVLRPGGCTCHYLRD